MQKLINRVLLVLFILTMSAAFIGYQSIVSKGHQLRQSRINNLPLQMGEWKGTELPVEQFVLDILETDYVLQRVYSDGRASVDLSIVFYKDSRVSLHLPESCLVGKGSKIVDRSLESIKVADEREIEVNRIDLKGTEGNQLLFYFFQTPDRTTSSYTKMRLYMMLDKLFAKENSGALVRMSVATEEHELNNRLKILKNFAKAIIPILPYYLN